MQKNTRNRLAILIAALALIALAVTARAQTCTLRQQGYLGGCSNVNVLWFTQTPQSQIERFSLSTFAGNFTAPNTARSFSIPTSCSSGGQVVITEHRTNGTACSVQYTGNLPHNKSCDVCGPAFLPLAAQHAASGGISAAPGSIISLYHEAFGVGIASAPALPLPASLSGLSVLIGGLPSSLFYVSPTQINCLVPAGLIGFAQIRVTRPDGSTIGGDIPLFDSIPGLFVKNGFAAANIERRASVTVLTLWGTGFNIVQGVPGRLDTGTTWLQLGNGRQFQSVYVGPSPTNGGNFPGLDQLNYVLPNADVPPGTIGAVVRLIRSDGRAWNSNPVELKFQ